MKFDLADFKTDTSKETDGVWVDFGGEASFKIASLDNAQFQKSFAAKKAPYDKQRKEMTEDEMKDVMVYCLSRYIVLDWKNIFEDETQLSYSVEAAERVIGEIVWLRNRIIEEARNISNFIAEVNEEVEKN